MTKTNLVILVIFGVLLFILGGGLGVLYKKQTDAEKVAAIKILSSKVIPTITSYGDVTKIEGRNVTLTYSGDSLTVALKDGARIFSFKNQASGSGAATGQQKTDISELKVGDNVSMEIVVSPDGKMQGDSMIILSAMPK